MGNQYAEILETGELSLLDTIDHVLNRGLVISGDITISVADIDLIYLGLNVVLGSIDTIDRTIRSREEPKIGQGTESQATGGDSGLDDL